MIIPALVGITQILLIALFLSCLATVFYAGAREGARAAAMLELYDRFPDLRAHIPLSDEARELRDSFLKSAQERVYQLWRETYKLPDTSETRALFNDKDYRKALEDQANA